MTANAAARARFGARYITQYNMYFLEFFLAVGSDFSSVYRHPFFGEKDSVSEAPTCTYTSSIDHRAVFIFVLFTLLEFRICWRLRAPGT